MQKKLNTITDLDPLKQRLRTEWPSWIIVVIAAAIRHFVSGVVDSSRAVMRVLYTCRNILTCCNELDSNLANLQATVEMG